MSSCESYIKHHWTIDLDSEEMDMLRAMMEIALEYIPTVDDHKAWSKLRDSIECVE